MLSNGIVTTIAGRPGISGFLDGPSDSALLNSPMRVAMTREGDIIIADGNGGLRLLRDDWSRVETLVPPSGSGGGGGGQAKHRDGPLDRARMSTCDGLCISKEGTVVVADSLNHCLRVIDPQMLTLSTLAGSKSGEWGAVDGGADECRMNRPCGMCHLNDDSLIFADAANNSIRVITFHSKPQPTTTISQTGSGAGGTGGGSSLKTSQNISHDTVTPSSVRAAVAREGARAREMVRKRQRAMERKREWERERERELERQRNLKKDADIRRQSNLKKDADSRRQRESFSPLGSSLLAANPWISETSDDEAEDDEGRGLRAYSLSPPWEGERRKTGDRDR